MATSVNSEFDVGALFDALNSERQARRLTWAQVTREINDLFRDVKCRPIATSTLTGMRERGGLAGNGVLQMLVWLDRTPESFVPGHPEAAVREARLPRVGPARILRWDTESLHLALDAARIARALTWRQVAEEIGGGWTAASLTGLRTRGNAGFPAIMRVTGWLGRPVASFTRASDW